MNSNKTWSEEDDIYLEAMWGNLRLVTISKNLKRSIRSIEHRASHLQLGGMYKESKFLMASQVAEIIGIHRSTVCKWIKNYDLKAKKVKLKHQAKYRITYDDLMDWLENNQDKWHSGKLEEYSLGEEPEWLILKRKSDSKKKVKRSTYSKEDDDKMLNLYMKGHSDLEIAIETGTSVDRVKRRIKYMRDTGIKIPYRYAGRQIKTA